MLTFLRKRAPRLVALLRRTPVKLCRQFLEIGDPKLGIDRRGRCTNRRTYPPVVVAVMEVLIEMAMARPRRL